MREINHYKWLEANLEDFFKKLGVFYCSGIITAHGDKCYCYEREWAKNGIPFHHGVAIYLLTYENPFEKEVRETKNGWVAPDEWVIKKYLEFKPLLNP